MSDYFFIKWRFSRESPRVHISEPFRTAEAAMASACVLLKFRAYVIWIEGPDDIRIGADEIVRNCRAWAEEDLTRRDAVPPRRERKAAPKGPSTMPTAVLRITGKAATSALPKKAPRRGGERGQ